MPELASEPLAEGRTAEIFRWDEQSILKLYRDWCPPDWVEYEARVAGAIHAAGIPSPAVGEIVEADGRRGLIYERLEGPSMLQDMNARPWMLFKHARSLADMQAKVHRQSIEGLPSYKDRLRFDILQAKGLSKELRDKALSILEALPEGQSVCHGDYHPGNIILTGDGPVIIDWMTACSGNSWTDVARSSLLLSIGAKSAGKMVSPLIRLVVKLYHQTYLNRYRAFVPDEKDELNHWKPVIAAARLNEEIISERDTLIKIVQEG